MTQNHTQNEEKYPLANLTDKIIGCSFEVFHELDYGHPEKVYQKAFAIELEKNKMIYSKEKFAKIKYHGDVVGRYFLDFLVDNKVAVELKVRREIYQSDWIQLLNYLKAENIKVGLLIVFTKTGPLIKRLIN